MTKFTASAACTLRVHCTTCRNREDGRAWRESLRAAFQLPRDAPDFECPHGVPWGYQGDAPAAASRRHLARPGDLVSIIIDQLGFHPTSGCECNKMRQKMNEWGWFGCWFWRDELVEWFVKKANEAGVTVERESVAGLIRTAIREAWRRRRQSSNE